MSLHHFVHRLVAVTSISLELKFELLTELISIKDFDGVHNLISEHAIDWFENSVPADLNIGEARLHCVAKCFDDETAEAWVLVLRNR